MAGQKFAGSLIGTVGFSALSGGVGAELTGGDFWKGAGQGAIVGLPPLARIFIRVLVVRARKVTLAAARLYRVAGKLASKQKSKENILFLLIMWEKKVY